MPPAIGRRKNRQRSRNFPRKDYLCTTSIISSHGKTSIFVGAFLFSRQKMIFSESLATSQPQHFTKEMQAVSCDLHPLKFLTIKNALC